MAPRTPRRRSSRGASPGRSPSPSARSESGMDSRLITPVDVSGGHDKFSTFFYRPHFVSALIVGYGTATTSRSDDAVENHAVLLPDHKCKIQTVMHVWPGCCVLTLDVCSNSLHGVRRLLLGRRFTSSQNQTCDVPC
eukprot:1567576-Rhodomonas_salina.4